MQIWQNVSETCQAIFECARKLLQGWKEENLCKARLGEGKQQPVMCAVSPVSAGSSNSSEMGEGEQQSVTRAVSTVSAGSSSPELREGEHQPVMHAVSTVSAGSSSSAQQQHIRWQKPGRGRLKCNVDTAFSSSLNVIGVGMCIRDEAGQFVAAKTLRSSPICESGIGEALGLSYAIQWVHELQLSNVDFEMDAKKGCRLLQ
jgi:hypothetical protein